jgi:uncharacterized damage-inducible protein DinB
MYLDFKNPGSSANPLKDMLIETFNYVRTKTVKLVSDLSSTEVDHNFDDKSNSIGTLLKHIAALEYYYQRFLFEKRDLSSSEREFWRGALPSQLFTRSVKGKKVEYYLRLLHEVRNDTMQFLSDKNDPWLFEVSVMASYQSANNYFWLFHLIEDELNHVGQMKLTILRTKKIII